MSNPKKANAFLTPSRKGFIANYPPFAQWKNALPSDVSGGAPLNLYVHTPFCAQRCSYCYYRTFNGAPRADMDNYVDALCQEIEMASRYFHLKDRQVVSVYYGGGTPTLMSTENLHKINDTLRKNFNLDGAEYTVEGEPVTLTKKKADVLSAIGVTRISMGVQSLSESILKIANRQDTEEKVLKAIEMAQKTGAVVNVDLMSGLAGETDESWAYSVDHTIATGVESITVYKMELYSNTQYYKDVRKNEIEIPSDEQELAFMQYAQDRFEQSQYLPWSFFTFTKEGKYEHRYATSIWKDGDCYPFGVSAFGELGQWVFQNTNDVENYKQTITQGELPINRGHHLNSLEQIIRSILLESKLVQFDLQSFSRRYGFRLQSLCGDVMNHLREEGFIQYDDDAILLTRKGISYGDYVGKSLAKAITDTY